MRTCFIVNPTAGRGRALEAWRRLEPQVGDWGATEVAVRFTERPRHGTELARAAAAAGFDRVVSVGGDGTLNEVGNGLVGSRTALAVVSVGSSNDWVRTAGVPMDAAAAARLALTGRVTRTDIGHVPGVRHFFNIAGVGFDAAVSHVFNRAWYKRLGGKLPNLMAVVQTLAAWQSPRVSVEIDGEVAEKRLFLMAVGIARYYGAGMMVLPDAIADDGLFEVVLGRDLGKGEVLGLLGKIFSGRHRGHPKIEFARGRRVALRSEDTVYYHLDGDVAGRLPVTFEIVPAALDVVVGPQAPGFMNKGAG